MISVIIPVFNITKKQHIFKKAIQSVRNQTFSELEIIIVNDGSSDDSKSLIDQFKRTDRRVYSLEKENGGVESARREGIKNASGEFIIHMDQDDLYMPDAFERMLEIANSSEADVVVANNSRFFYNKRLQFGKKDTPSLKYEQVIDHDTFMSHYYQSFFGINDFPVNIWNKLYRKSFLDSIPEPPLTNCIIEDLSYNMHVLPYASRIAVIPDVTYLYRWGGWTNHFDPTVLDTAITGYKLKKNLIEQYSLPYIKSTSIELLNYLNTYFYSMLEYEKVSDATFKVEVKRVLSFPEVKEACAVVKHGMERFPHMDPIIKGDIDALYKIDQAVLDKNRLRNAMKRIALFFSNR